MPTMQDIADRAGVHRATVSNVLNGRFAARRPDAARRAAVIRRIADELGYRPSHAARATRTGRTGLIGMVRGLDLTRSVHTPMFEAGVDAALHGAGLCLVRDLIDRDDDPDYVPRIVREDTVDGLLINYAFDTPPAIQGLLDRCGLPAVWINQKLPANCVHPDDEAAARWATRHLLDHGHTDVAFVLGTSAEVARTGRAHYSFLDRLAGYRDTMHDAGLAPRLLRVPPVPADRADRPGHVLRCYVELLRGADPRPTAVLCLHDGRVMMHAAAKLGLDVPRELSVVTFDNDAGAGQRVAVDRALVDYEALGRAAVAELLARVAEPAADRAPVAVSFELQRAGTVAGPIRDARAVVPSGSIDHVC